MSGHRARSLPVPPGLGHRYRGGVEADADSIWTTCSDELLEAAASVAGGSGRNVEEQLVHWARVGRELESSPSIAHAAVAAVLAGDASYDELEDGEQAIVRAVWCERIAARLGDLDLVVEFRNAGLSWVELAEDGSIVRVDPAAECWVPVRGTGDH